MISGKRSTLARRDGMGKRSEFGGGGSTPAVDATPIFPPLLTREIAISNKGPALESRRGELVIGGLELEDRGAVVELTTEFGDYATFNALQLAGGMTSFWELTYDASPANFAAGSDGLLDGVGGHHLTRAGTSFLNFTAFGNYVGRILVSSGSTSFDRLYTGAELALHQGGPRGAVLVFRLGATPSDTRSIALFGSYGGTSAWFEVRTFGGNVMVVEPGTTTGVVLGSSASLVGARIMLFVNQVVRTAAAGGGIYWEVTWGELYNTLQTEVYVPAVRAGRALDVLSLGGFTPNIYRVESVQIFHAAVKEDGCLTESYKTAFAVRDF